MVDFSSNLNSAFSSSSLPKDILIQPITTNSFDIDVVPAIGCAIEWERDIQESVNKVYNNYPLFFKVVIIFYYNL